MNKGKYINVMEKKGFLIGVFVKKNKILSFIEELKNKYKIKSDKVFVYEIDTNDFEYLVTFKAYDKDKFINKLIGSTVLHVKNKCIFSINALNKLIEAESCNESVKHSEYVVNWNNFENKLLLMANGKFSISNINKIEDKSVFFK